MAPSLTTPMSDWTWEFTDTAQRAIESLDDYARERVIENLDDVVDDEWREPTAYLEPLAGAPHETLRIGPFRAGVRTDPTEQDRSVRRRRKRGGDAYRSDDE